MVAAARIKRCEWGWNATNAMLDAVADVDITSSWGSTCGSVAAHLAVAAVLLASLRYRTGPSTHGDGNGNWTAP